MASKETTAKKIEEVVCPYCTTGKWCLLKEILVSKHTDPRFLIQLKCIEHLKWEESQTVGHDIKWELANKIWIERGFEEAFAQFYSEELTAEQIYEKIIKYLKK